MQPPGGKKSYEQLTVDILQRLQAGGVLTDVNPGSVMRTLVEAFARQLALAYEQLSLIYELGFIDTATGDALDHLVSLLGQQRYQGQQAVGEVTLQRDPRVAGQVTIPAETALQVTLARQPAKPLVYKTRRDAVLAAGQSAVSAEIYAPLPAAAPPESVLLQAGDVPVTVTPATQLAGVAGAVIGQATSVRGQAESDADLRARVKGLIVAAGGGTAKALEQAALSAGLARAVTLRDAQDDLPIGGFALRPGELEVVADTTPAQHADLRLALQAAKGPGIYARLRDIERRPIALDITLKVTGDPSPEQRDKLYRSAEQVVRQAVESLQPGDRLRWNPVLASLLKLDGVADLDAATLYDGAQTAALVEGGASKIAAYPVTFDQYSRLVPADNRRPVTIHLTGEQVIYIGLRFDSLPDALKQQLGITDPGRVAGVLEDLLEKHLLGLNQAMTKAQNQDQRPKLDPKALQAAVYAGFGSYYTATAGFHITYRDSRGGAQTELQVGDAAVSFAPAQVLRPSPDGVLISAWGP